MTMQYKRSLYLLLPLLVIVLASNYAVYHITLPFDIQSGDMKWVAAGSLLDLMVVVPLLLFVMTKGKHVKWTRFIAYIAFGAVVARLVIPMTYFEPFRYVTYVAFIVEAAIVLVELGIVFILIWRLPQIITTIKQLNMTPLFSLQKATSEKVSRHFIVRMIVSECLIFYYAFASWRKISPQGLTMHNNTSLIAFYIMIIHAIIIETIGIHWWLHDKWPIISIILLVSNVYAVIFFISDIQALRLNPLIRKDGNIYLSLGLMKRMVIPLEKINTVQWEGLSTKIDLKTTIDFIAKDFETMPPHCVIVFTEPLDVFLPFGITRKYKKAAIRVDHPAQLRDLFE